MQKSRMYWYKGFCLLAVLAVLSSCSLKSGWGIKQPEKSLVQQTEEVLKLSEKAENAEAAEEVPEAAGDMEAAEDVSEASEKSKMQEIQMVQETLPSVYDARQQGKTPNVKNQGLDGNCWAYAALSALKISLLPEYRADFSVSHLTQDWSPYLQGKVGGDYTMSMAYLLSWRGPILTKEEEKGVVCHVQEVRVLEEKDISAIKQAVWNYGSVQTSFYSDFPENGDGESKWYCVENSAYCCLEEHSANHDVVILGWDDTYPKENFVVPPESDGAFLCLNSWGEQFGQNGYFYVSYEDTVIGTYAVIYSAADTEGMFRYQHLYETDACGWMGQIGYHTEDIWFSNIYTAEREEWLAAAGFYVLEPGSTYEVFIKMDWEGQQDFCGYERVAAGAVDFMGYSTVPFDRQVKISRGERFAVIVKLHAPSGQAAAAVEFWREDIRAEIEDGEGYLSWNGEDWERAENVQSCNLCLKAYTIEEIQTEHK